VKNKNQIVIYTNETDPHSDVIVDRLKSFEIEPIRLNTNDIPKNISIEVDFGSPKSYGRVVILPEHREIELNSVQSVYWRRPEDFYLPEEFTPEEVEFADRELKEFFSGFWSNIPSHVFWMSKPSHVSLASRKLEQISRALKFGFQVPKTTVTNDASHALDFYNSNKNGTIYKSLSYGLVGSLNLREYPELEHLEIKELKTTLIEKKHVKKLADLRFVPCLFQEYIKKKYELRVTIVEDEVFSAEIHSQEDNLTKIDWRNSSVDIPYRIARLPAAFEQKCIEFVKSYGLNYSALDFIYTPDDQYVFLENNPNGQYYWIEKKLQELGISEAIAKSLMKNRL
jgi:glutathione synthase/RimK-type ligase-like ATP-grasp enzyme